MSSVRQASVLLLVVSSLPAQELFSWHTAEITVPVTRQFSVALHTRLRSRDELHDLNQVRGGVELGYNAGPYSFTAAYIYEPSQPEPGRAWQPAHRATAGVLRDWRLTPSSTITSRFLYERFYTFQRGDFNRYRTGVRWEYGRSHGPFIHHEWMFVNEGFQSLRNIAGWSFRPAPRWSLEAGYLFDVRPEHWNGNRQAIVTAVRYQLGE